MPREFPGIFWARQRLPRPELQMSQPGSLQGMTAGMITFLPIRSAGPATTVPLISWPRVRGGLFTVGTPS
jgi:hypothetical protein